MRKVNISQMRYRGREDICHKTTDEARPDSGEFSFTEGFGFFFFYFVIIQITSSRLEKLFWVLKRNIRRHYLKHKASAYAVTYTYVFLGSFVGCSALQLLFDRQ